jgi:teichuronic acid biosynthesis glycosyltransferase TuaG
MSTDSSFARFSVAPWKERRILAAHEGLAAVGEFALIPSPQDFSSGDRRRLPISVVIPAYNREDLVGAALQSAFDQTQPPAEVIVIDDGSSDRTADVAQSLGATVIRQVNCGVSCARNVGIRAASQPWVAFLDSDDVWLPSKLELQWAALEACPAAGWAFGDRETVREDGAVPRAPFTSLPDYARVSKRPVTAHAVNLELEGLGNALLRGNFIGLSSLVARRDLLISVGLYAEDMRYCEDVDLMLRLSAAAPVVAVEKPVYIHRIHVGGASRARARMQLGRAQIADRVTAAPDRYLHDALEFCVRDRPLRLKRAGMLFWRTGEFANASGALRSSLRYRFDAGAAMAFVLTGMLAALHADLPYSNLRNVWHNLRNARDRAPSDESPR